MTLVSKNNFSWASTGKRNVSGISVSKVPTDLSLEKRPVAQSMTEARMRQPIAMQKSKVEDFFNSVSSGSSNLGTGFSDLAGGIKDVTGSINEIDPIKTDSEIGLSPKTILLAIGGIFLLILGLRAIRGKK